MSISIYKQRKLLAKICIAGMLFSAVAPVGAAPVWGAEASQPTAQAPFTDTAESYAANEIAYLSSAGILNGFEDGTFRPREAVTRAQFAKVMAAALELEADAGKAAGFRDVPQDAWYAGHVGALVQEGIAEGTGPEEFSPDKPVSREELAVFFIRSMKLTEWASIAPVEGEAFADFAHISEWAKPAVSLAFQIGFLQGQENGQGQLLFVPKASAERQALARLAYEFVEHKDDYISKAREIAGAASSAAPSATPAVSPSATPSGGGGVPIGGGGGGGSTPTPKPADGSTVSNLEAGEYTGSFTVAKGVSTFGPASGTAVVSGKLTVDPGAEGSVTLRNIQAADVEILSGAENSIHLNHVKVTGKLAVKAANQAKPVRIVAGAGTSIAETLVNSAAILETGDLPQGDQSGLGVISISDAAANAVIEFRGSSNSRIIVRAEGATIKTAGGSSISWLEAAAGIKVVSGGEISNLVLTAPEATTEISGRIASIRALAAGGKIVVNSDASVEALSLEENGNTIQADGSIRLLLVSSPQLELSLTGQKAEELKAGAKAAALTAIGELGAPAGLTWEHEQQVREVIRQTWAIQRLDFQWQLPEKEAILLNAAAEQMQAFAQGHAEEALVRLPESGYLSAQTAEEVSALLDTAQEAVNLAVEWGISPWELAGYNRMLLLSDNLKMLFTTVHVGLSAGDPVIIGQSGPGAAIRIEVFQDLGYEAGPTAVLEATADANGIFSAGDPDIFPLQSGYVVITATSAGQKHQYQNSYNIKIPDETTEAPVVAEPYYQGDPLVITQDNTTIPYPRFIIALNGQGQLVGYKSFSFSYIELVFPNGPYQTVSGETIRVYAQGWNLRTSPPTEVKVQPNKGITEKPVYDPVYDEDLVIKVKAASQAMVRMTREGQQDYYALSDEAGIAVFRLNNAPVKAGEAILFTAKESGKAVSAAASATALSVSGKTDKPQISVEKLDSYWRLDVAAIQGEATMLKGEHQGNYYYYSIQPASDPYMLSISFSYDVTEIYVYAKLPGKAISDPEVVLIEPKTALPEVVGTIYPDSLKIKASSIEPYSTVTLKHEDGSVIYQDKEIDGFSELKLETMNLPEELAVGETILLTVTAPGKEESSPLVSKVEANEGKTALPSVYGTLYKDMAEAGLTVDTGVQLTGAGIKIHPAGAADEAGYTIVSESPVARVAFDSGFLSGESVMVTVKEHGKEPSEPVAVKVHPIAPATPLFSVTSAVYLSQSQYETISGKTEPLAHVRVQKADIEIGSGWADELGDFNLEFNVRASLLQPGDLLQVTAQGAALPESSPASAYVYEAQGITPTPSVQENVYTYGSYFIIPVKIPAGAALSIGDNEFDTPLFVSEIAAGEPGTMVEQLALIYLYPDTSLDRTLTAWAQTPGQLRSEYVFIDVHEAAPSNDAETTQPDIAFTAVNHVDGIAAITGQTQEPYTLITLLGYGEPVTVIADENGVFSGIFSFQRGMGLMIIAQAPGKKPVDWYEAPFPILPSPSPGGGTGGGGGAINIPVSP